MFTPNSVTPGSYDDLDNAPEIMFYNGVGYDHYYYIADAYDADGNEVTDWADVNGDVASDLMIVGTGAWMRIPASACITGAMTSAGAVQGADSFTVDLASGLTLASNPYPIAFDFSKLSTAGIVAGSYDDLDNAPEIMFYNGVGYDHYYYIADAYNADGNEVTAWADVNGDECVGPVAAVGQAFWSRSNTVGRLTFVK